MKCDVTKIEGYAEMTPEQKVAALETLDIEIPDTKKLKEALDKATSEAAENKRKWKDTLSEAERTAQELADEAKAREEKLAEYEKKEVIGTLTRRYMSLGFDETEALKLAEKHNNNDLESVFSAIGSFIKEKEKMAIAEKVKEIPAPHIGDPDKKTEKRVKDIPLEELQKIYDEDREEFNSLK